MKSYPQIAARLFGTPLLLLPEKAEILASVLADRLGVGPMVEVESATPLKAALLGASPDPDARPYEVNDGVAIIQVIGELVNRGSWLDAVSGLVSYEALASALRTAAADPQVSGIVLDVDSPGGEAAGAMETGALVRQVSTRKPVTAFVNGMAASAAYAIASGAPRIVVAPSATLGSIGVVMLHVDRSEQMAKRGLKPTLLKKGAFKTDGTSLEPLASDARSRIEALLDVVYGLFVSTVATHRPGLDLDAVKATEAGLFIGTDAVKAGLADTVGTLEDTLRAMTAAPRANPLMMLRQENQTMTDITRADHDTAVATATATGSKAGASAERARVSAILAHAEAKGRESLAQHLAFETDMAPEAAAALLKASPKAEAPAGGSRLDGRVPVPPVDPDQAAGADKADLSDYDKGKAEAKALLGIG